MPYEDDYKMWLEKMLIESNPDWVCDGMYDMGFTHEWCKKYCGEDSEYVTPKCLHMYYHHIVKADRKTEPQTDWKDEMWTEAVEDEPQTEKGGCTNCDGKDLCNNAFTEISQYCGAYEPQNERSKFVKVSDRECPWCKAVCASTDKYCHECGWHIADTPQTESTGSPIGDYRDGVGAWQTDCPWK